MNLKIAFLFILALTTGTFISCKPRTGQPETTQAKTIKKEREVYMCPFHTNIERQNPGKCPKCGRDLVRVVRKLADSTRIHED